MCSATPPPPAAGGPGCIGVQGHYQGSTQLGSGLRKGKQPQERVLEASFPQCPAGFPCKALVTQPPELPAAVLRLARQGGMPGLATWHPGTPGPHHSPSPSQTTRCLLNKTSARPPARGPARGGLQEHGPRWRIRAAGPAPCTALAHPQSPRDHQATPLSGAGDTPVRCAILWRSLVLLWHESFVTASGACLPVSGSRSWACHLHQPSAHLSSCSWPGGEGAWGRGAAETLSWWQDLLIWSLIKTSQEIEVQRRKGGSFRATCTHPS